LQENEEIDPVVVAIRLLDALSERRAIKPKERKRPMANVNKNDKTVQLDTCATAIVATFPATQTWVFAGTTYIRDAFVGVLRGCINATQTTRADHDQWRASVHAEKQQYALLRPALASFKKELEAQYGPQSTKLAEYGFTPAHPPVKTAATKAESAAKAKATKQAKKAAIAALPPHPPAQPAAPAAAPAAPAAAPALPGSVPTKS
jgi:hypothetical protein